MSLRSKLPELDTSYGCRDGAEPTSTLTSADHSGASGLTSGEHNPSFRSFEDAAGLVILAIVAGNHSHDQTH